MQFKVRVRRWVAWWFYIGILCGGIALANIFGHHLTRSQEEVLLLIGMLHWLLGGLICWAFESVQIRPAPREEAPAAPAAAVPETEWHPASDFLVPGRRSGRL